MAEFSLPKNSKITKGKHFPVKNGGKNVRTFKIYRWSPDDDRTRAPTPMKSIWTPAARWSWTP
jgi:hypothetical protein